MPAITFIHTADWQLGKPYQRITDPTKRSQLQTGRFECIRRIGELVLSHDASFVLVAGDLFDSPSPLDATVAKACESIGNMRVPVLVIPGNHDHGGPGSLWEQPFFLRQRDQLAPNLRVLLSPEPVILDQAVILPAPLVRRQDHQDPTSWIRSAADSSTWPAGLPRIVLAHGSVQGFDSSQEDEDEEVTGQNRIDLSRLPDQELDYIALGDWHGTKAISAKAWYSGTPEIDRFPKGTGNDPGNVLVVKAARNQTPDVIKVSTGRFRWNEFSHRFTEDEGFDAFRTSLESHIGEWGQDSLLKLTLDGSLGIETSQRLEDLIGDLTARLLRMKLDNRVAIAPTADEIRALAERPGDPLIAAVAGELIAMSRGADPETARLALRELHAAIR